MGAIELGTSKKSIIELIKGRATPDALGLAAGEEGQAVMATAHIRVFQYKVFDRESGRYLIATRRATVDAIDRILGFPLLQSDCLLDCGSIDEDGFEREDGCGSQRG